MSKLFQLHNISGDLLKITKGEDVEIPAEFADKESYEAHLLAQHQQERDEFYQTRLSPKIKEMIEEEKKKQYPAIANPILNRIKAWGGYSDEDLKGKSLTEALEMYREKEKDRISAAKSTGDKSSKELIKEMEQKDNTIIRLKADLDKAKLEYEDSLNKSKLEIQAEKDKYIHDDLFSKKVMKLKDDLSLPIDTLIHNVEYSLSKRGYRTRVDGKGIKVVGENGENKLDLTGSKNAIFEELVIQCAKEDGYYRTSHGNPTDQPPNPGGRRRRDIQWE